MKFLNEHAVKVTNLTYFQNQCDLLSTMMTLLHNTHMIVLKYLYF